MTRVELSPEILKQHIGRRAVSTGVVTPGPANLLRLSSGRAESSRNGMEMALEVTDLALQLHGGYDFSREFPVERLLREARGMVLGGGPPQLQRNMIADELIKRGFPSWI